MSASKCATLTFAAAVAAATVWLASAQPADAPPTPPPAATQPLELFYIMSPNCEKCKQSGPIVEAAARKYAGRLRLTRLSVLDPDDLDRIMAIEGRLKLPAAAPPRIIVGSRCLTGLEEITARLDAVLAAELPPATTQPTTTKDSG